MFPGVFSQTNIHERTLYPSSRLPSLLSRNEEAKLAGLTELGEKRAGAGVGVLLYRGSLLEEMMRNDLV